MTVVLGSTTQVGQTSQGSRGVYLWTDQNFSTVTTAGFLNTNLPGFTVNNGDFFYIAYNSNANYAVFYPSIDSSGIVTLAQLPIPSNGLQSSLTTPDTNANTVRFDVTAGQAALASGGSVTLYTSSGTKQYKVASLQINSGGTNFSGGGGDRLGQITDGTTVYSVIPAASLQTLANAQWGVTALPNPASAAINTSTAAGASLVFKYSGGTTDYTAGSIVISGTLIRVA